MWHLWYIRSSSCSSIVVHQLDGCVVPDLGLLCLQGYTTPIIRTVLFLFLPSFGVFFFRCCLTTGKALSRQFNEGGRFEFDLFRIESSWKREWKKKMFAIIRAIICAAERNRDSTYTCLMTSRAWIWHPCDVLQSVIAHRRIPPCCCLMRPIARKWIVSFSNLVLL